MKLARKPSSSSSGFTLVEVSIAIGIVAIALVSILGTYGSLQSQSGDSNMRDDAAFATNSIRNYLQGKKGLDSILSEIISEGESELIFFSYRGVEPKQPDGLAQNIYSFCTDLNSNWLAQETFPGVTNAEIEEARDGQMYRAVLKLNESVNPVEQSDLDPNPENYHHGFIALQLSLYDIYDPSQATALLSERRPVIETTLVITR